MKLQFQRKLECNLCERQPHTKSITCASCSLIHQIKNRTTTTYIGAPADENHLHTTQSTPWPEQGSAPPTHPHPCDHMQSQNRLPRLHMPDAVGIRQGRLSCTSCEPLASSRSPPALLTAAVAGQLLRTWLPYSMHLRFLLNAPFNSTVIFEQKHFLFLSSLPSRRRMTCIHLKP